MKEGKRNPQRTKTRTRTRCWRWGVRSRRPWGGKRRAERRRRRERGGYRRGRAGCCWRRRNRAERAPRLMWTHPNAGSWCQRMAGRQGCDPRPPPPLPSAPPPPPPPPPSQSTPWLRSLECGLEFLAAASNGIEEDDERLMRNWEKKNYWNIIIFIFIFDFLFNNLFCYFRVYFPYLIAFNNLRKYTLKPLPVAISNFLMTFCV